MPQTVDGTGSAVTIEAKILFVENVLKSSRCHLRKIRLVGSGMRYGSLAAAEVTDDFWGVFTPTATTQSKTIPATISS